MGIKFNETIKDGKLDGWWRDYWSNGNVYFQRFYLGGNIEGLSEIWYPSGKLENKSYWSSGFTEGEQISYFYDVQ